MRIDDPNRAADIAGSLIKANELRVTAQTRVRGMLDGNQPYNAAILRQQAQSYRCNVNFREGEAIQSAAVSPYYDLFAEARYYAEVAVEDPNPNVEVNNSKIVTQEFDRMLRSYSGFDYNMQMAIADMVSFGQGFVFWECPFSWWFRNIKQNRVLVPDNTPADVDKLELLVVRQTWTVHELFKMIRDPEAASAFGWNVPAVQKEIAMADPDYMSQPSGYDFEERQRQVRSNDLYESIRSNTVRTCHLYVREFDGKITHQIVSERGPVPTHGGWSQESKEFMFVKRDRFENFRQIIGSLFFDLGDGTWHSIKGLLIKMYPFIEIKNRLNCAMVDNTFLNMSVLVQPTTEKSFEEAIVQPIGPFFVMRHGLNVVQWGLSGRMEEGLAVEQRLDSKLSGNIGQYRQTVAKDRGNPETATKVRADVFKETTLTKGAVNRMYSQLDFIYAEIYRRALNPDLTDDDGGPNSAVLEFRRRCRDKGVTMAQLKKVRQVRAYRNIGSGSPFLRQQAVLEMQSFIPLMNDAGRQNWLDDAIGVTTNHDLVERYNPKTGTKPGDDAVIASLQAASMKDLVPPVMTDTQDHFTFAQVYLEEAAREVGRLPAGAEPTQVAQFLNIIGPSIAMRLQAIPANHPRRDEMDQMVEQWKKLAQIADQLNQRIAAAQQNAQATQMNQGAMLSDDAQKALAALRDQERKDQLVKSEIARKTAKAQVDMDVKAAKARQQLAIEARKAALTEEQEPAETEE